MLQWHNWYWLLSCCFLFLSIMDTVSQMLDLYLCLCFIAHDNSIIINSLDTKFTEIKLKYEVLPFIGFVLSASETKLMISEVYLWNKISFSKHLLLYALYVILKSFLLCLLLRSHLNCSSQNFSLIYIYIYNIWPDLPLEQLLSKYFVTFCHKESLLKHLYIHTYSCHE